MQFKRCNFTIITSLARAKFIESDFNSILGVGWSLLHPLLVLILLYTIFRHQVFRTTGMENYPLYLLSGIVIVNYFSNVTTQILTTFSFQRELLLNSPVTPCCVVFSELTLPTVRLCWELVLCLILAAVNGTLNLFLLPALPLIVLALIVFSLGFGMILALIFTYVRDVQYLWSIATRLLLLITPVFYSVASFSPIQKACLYLLNPLSLFVASYRCIFINTYQDNYPVFILSFASGICSCTIGSLIFFKYEKKALERA